jgi:glutathione S-transferase
MATPTPHQVETARGKPPSVQIAHTIPGMVAYHTGKGAPNPLFVECFAMERHVDIFMNANNLDVGKAQNRLDPACQKLNPGGGVPFLELEGGEGLAETVTMCEYMDATAPGGAIMTGLNPKEKAVISMWMRRIEQHIVLPLYAHLRWGPAKKMFATRGMHGLLANDDAANQQLAVSKNQLEWLDGLMVQAGNPEFICCNKITINDIFLYTQLDWFNNMNKGVIKKDWFSGLKWVPAWFARMDERPALEVAKDWNTTHDYSTRVRLLLNSKLDNVPSQGRVELSQLGASERYTGMAPSKL